MRQLTLKLLRKEFGDLLAGVEWCGSYEGEDIAATVFLKEEPADLSMRSCRIRGQLYDAGFDVGIVRDWPNDESEEEAK